MALLSNEMEAEDVTQDVLIKLWEQRAHLDKIASPKAYAIRIARNKCIDTLRAPAQRLRNAEAVSYTHLLGSWLEHLYLNANATFTLYIGRRCVTGTQRRIPLSSARETIPCLLYTSSHTHSHL